ncbi:hypothetical protein VDIAB_270390 [Vibrio diabolicus]|nr:hypothetical protein VDIAB_270390 [Vibrio diabolicus]
MFMGYCVLAVLGIKRIEKMEPYFEIQHTRLDYANCASCR